MNVSPAATTPKSAGSSNRVRTRGLAKASTLLPPDGMAAQAKPRTPRPRMLLSGAAPARPVGGAPGPDESLTSDMIGHVTGPTRYLRSQFGRWFALAAVGRQERHGCSAGRID